MTSKKLKEALEREVERWAKKGFIELSEMSASVEYENEEQGDAFYVTEVNLLEKNDRYIHVGIAVDDGGIRAFVPVSTSIIVYKDGRVEK